MPQEIHVWNGRNTARGIFVPTSWDEFGVQQAHRMAPILLYAKVSFVPPVEHSSTEAVSFQLTAQEGEADRLLAILSESQKSALSDKEPGTLQYKISRDNTDSNVIMVAEVYARLGTVCTP